MVAPSTDGPVECVGLFTMTLGSIYQGHPRSRRKVSLISEGGITIVSVCALHHRSCYRCRRVVDVGIVVLCRRIHHCVSRRRGRRRGRRRCRCRSSRTDPTTTSSSLSALDVVEINKTLSLSPSGDAQKETDDAHDVDDATCGWQALCSPYVRSLVCMSSVTKPAGTAFTFFEK
jgi:hypothetical protein